MCDDVIIGTGDKGCSAIKVFEFKGDYHISENRVSYWIRDTFLDVRMTIFKYTKEGIALKQMIDEKEDPVLIQDFIDDALLANINKKILKEAINRAMITAHNAGSEAKAKEFRKCLGLLK